VTNRRSGTGWVVTPPGHGALCEQRALFGEVASDSTAYRLIEKIGSDPDLIDALRSAHAAARERFWDLHGAPESLTIDVDATLVTAHSEKEDAAWICLHGRRARGSSAGASARIPAPSCPSQTQKDIACRRSSPTKPTQTLRSSP
jgi:hypothetical protein